MRQRNSYEDSLHKGIEESLTYSDRDVVSHILIVGKKTTPFFSFPRSGGKKEHLEHATEETGRGNLYNILVEPSNVLRQIWIREGGRGRRWRWRRDHWLCRRTSRFQPQLAPDGLRRHKTEFNRSAQRLIFPSSRKMFLHLDKTRKSWLKIWRASYKKTVTNEHVRVEDLKCECSSYLLKSGPDSNREISGKITKMAGGD